MNRLKVTDFHKLKIDEILASMPMIVFSGDNGRELFLLTKETKKALSDSVLSRADLRSKEKRDKVLTKKRAVRFEGRLGKAVVEYGYVEKP